MSAYQGGSVRSIRPFKSSEQYLYAMKEDMAEWLTDLYNLDINVDNFLEVLETGSILCQHANYIMQVAGEFSVEYPTLAKKIQLPKTVVKFNALAQPGTFLARDNVSNFIQWCRTEMDIKDVLMFETEDLVLRKNEKNFVLCLLELARRASRFGMSAPMLIQLEEQIEEEIREELDLPPEEIPIPKPQRKLCNFKNLDQMVQHLVSRCTCPEQFSMIKVSEGKYKVGESNTLIFVRILRNHVMVRVGGGWDTLEHYLDKHDPCRCTSLSHKQALKIGGQPRLSTPVHEIKTQLTPRSDNPNKFQTTLIVSRSQSPLPPVEWRTYTSGNRSFSSSSSTPEAADRTAGRRTPHFQLDQRKIISPRAEEPPSATSRRQVFAEDGQPSQPHISPRSGQEKNRISRFSLVSQRSEDNVFGTSEIGSLAHQGKQAGRSRSRSLMEPMTKNLQTNHVNSSQSRIQPGGEKAIMHQMSKTAPQMSIAQETRPKTPSHFIRPPSPSKVIQQNKIVDSKAKTINTERPLSPTKQVNHSAKQDLSARRSVSCNPVSNRPLTPSSISSNPVPNRVPTPSRNYQSDLQSRIRSMSLGKEQINPHKTLGATRSIYIGDAQNKTIQTGRSTPQTQTNKNGMAQVKNRVSSCTPRMQSRQGHRDSRAPSNLDAEDRDSMLTPLPLDPEEEKALYRSLEDEILSNIRVLEVDSDENNNLESKSGDVTSECSIASNVAVHDFKTNRTSISAVPSITNSLRIPNGEKEVPRSGVYIDAKWPTGGSFDDVISELATGRLKLNKVDVEDWISKISSKGIVGDITETDSSLPCATHERKQLGTGKQRTFVKKKSSFADTKGNKPKQLPSQRARQLAMEARKALEAVLAAQTSVSNQTSSDTCPNEESASHTKSLQTPKPKRSLKKPERVPSIYKLKLRPKIRPRRDNRPEKKPSRIPTPITYRQLQNKSKPKEPRSPNNKNEASSRTRNASQGTSVGIEDLDSDEGACSSELSASTEVTNSMNDHNSAVQNPSKAEDNEESWV